MHNNFNFKIDIPLSLAGDFLHFVDNSDQLITSIRLGHVDLIEIPATQLLMQLSLYPFDLRYSEVCDALISIIAEFGNFDAFVRFVDTSKISSSIISSPEFEMYLENDND